MPLLWCATLIWAFSFSLIGVYLAGQVDSYFSVLTRIALATLVFVPLLIRHPIAPRLALRLAAIGAIQLGLMYLFYYHSFLLLSVPEVLVFTIFTPLYVTLLHDLLQGRFQIAYLLTAAVAVAGAAVIRLDHLDGNWLGGFLVVQGANICFAAGQVLYKHLINTHSDLQLAQHQRFGWFFVGALAIALPAWIILGGDKYPATATQWGILLWLGVVASGLGYFIWNLGASRVNAAQLAVMNDVLIPAGLLVNLLIWNRDTDILRLAAGSLLLILALWLSRQPWKRPPSNDAKETV